MENDKLFEFMEKMYSDFSKRFDGLENEVRKTNTVIENDIQPKINVLFDGYHQLNEKTTRIEEQVSKHDEIIIKRIK